MKTIEKRILFVSPISPFEPRTGGEQRSLLMYRSLCALGNVDVIQLCPGHTTSISAVEKQGAQWVFASVANAELTWRRFQPKACLTAPVEHLLGCKLADYDLVVGRYIWPVCQLEIPANVPVIADLDDYLFHFDLRGSWTFAMLKMWLKKNLGNAWARRQIRRFAGAFFVCAADQQRAPNILSEVVPNVPVNLPSRPTLPPANQKLLFVGSLWYPPNHDGINWFLKSVWPHVLAGHPHASLLLAGSANSQTRANWERTRGVQAPGFVDDLDAAYRDAAIVIVPVRSGGGSTIKLIEALAHLRPCVSTRVAYLPFIGQLENGKHLLVAENADAFVQHINELLANPLLGQNLAKAGRQVVETEFTAGIFETGVVKLVRLVLAREQSRIVDGL